MGRRLSRDRDGETLKRFPGGFTVIGQPLSGDSTRAKIKWDSQGHGLAFEKPVRIIFDLHLARLYSFWLGRVCVTRGR